jgi:diguanylate cyclase (GGDEF)-like protein/PAS domain S-box-containing protein
MSNEEFYKSLLDNLHDGVYFVDRERKITYWNKGAERITGFAADEVVGKHCSDNVLSHVDKNGRSMCSTLCPLADTICDGNARTNEIFLRHKDGHRVPVRTRVTSLVGDDGTIVGGVEIFTDATPAADALDRIAELERLAYIDPLTGLTNRRYGEITLRARIEEMQRYGWRFGVVFIDVDRFKDVNDRFGHEAGDSALVMVAKTLLNSARSFDVVSRWGGEEFLIIIANIDNAELRATAERFRALVEHSQTGGAFPMHVTISAGATLARPEDTAESVVRRADELMYESKKKGRNRVTVGA